MSSVSSRKIEVNNVALHCDITGTGSHTVLLLPGALGGYMKTVFCIAINMQIMTNPRDAPRHGKRPANKGGCSV